VHVHARVKLVARTMVSIVVVGPAMSGKTQLCAMLADLPGAMESRHDETCGVDYLKLDVNCVPWHVWDTPRLDSDGGWAGEAAAREASIVVVCHDGRRSFDLMRVVREFGVDRCIIALTRTPLAGASLNWAVSYLRTTDSRGSLIPVVPVFECALQLVAAISRHPSASLRGLG
jgi:hypothetical protein